MVPRPEHAAGIAQRPRPACRTGLSPTTAGPGAPAPSTVTVASSATGGVTPRCLESGDARERVKRHTDHRCSRPATGSRLPRLAHHRIETPLKEVYPPDAADQNIRRPPNWISNAVGAAPHRPPADDRARLPRHLRELRQARALYIDRRHTSAPALRDISASFDRYGRLYIDRRQTSAPALRDIFTSFDRYGRLNVDRRQTSAPRGAAPAPADVPPAPPRQPQPHTQSASPPK